MKAKKQKNVKKTWLALIEASILFGLAATILVARTALTPVLAATSFLSVFLVVFVLSIILGFVLKIVVNNLGGSGRYYEGLTVIAYSLVPLSAALFVGSLLAMLPGGVILSAIVLAVGFASGISILYRSIKELFKTDLLTSLIAVSVLILVVFVAASVSFGLTTVARLGTLLPIG